MRCDRLRASAWLALVVLAVAAAPPDAFSGDPPEAAIAASGKRKLAGGGMWWRNPAVASELSLSKEQLESMKRQYQSYLKRIRRGSNLGAREAFAEALAAGNWDAAQEKLDEMAEELAAPLRAQGELKIRLLGRLSEKQRKRFVEKYPQLLRRSWGRAGPASKPLPKREGRRR